MPDFEEDIDQDSKSDDELSNEGSFDENGGLRITPNVEGEKKELPTVTIPNSDVLEYPPGFTPETDVDAQKNASKVLDMEGHNSGHKVQDVEQESVTKNNSPLNSYKNDTERFTCSYYCLNIIAKLPYCREVPTYHEPLIAIVSLLLQDDRHGSIFNAHGADPFNLFISSAGLEEVPLDG
ncbi:hypothetical protein Tco_1066064 [Tanacetum coccineum]